MTRTPRQAPLRQRLRLALVLLSFLAFPLTLNFLSPYLIVVGAGQGVITGSFILFGVLFVASLFVGRLWCGWLCPGAGMAQVATWVNDAPFQAKRADRIKWVIWTPWILLIAGLAFSAGGYRLVDPLFQTEGGISVSEPSRYVVYFAVLALFVGLAIAFGRRAGCHTVCWMAPFMILGRSVRNRLGLPALQLVTTPETCSRCRTCTINCPMSLPVDELVQTGRIEHPECILCTTCADGCRKGTIVLTVARPPVDRPGLSSSSAKP